MVKLAALVSRCERIQRVNNVTFLREACRSGRADTSRRGIADRAVTTESAPCAASLSSHVHGGRVASLRPSQQKPGSIAVPQPVIRPARSDEYDQIARVWMDSWVSTGLEDASDSLLAKLRARVSMEVEKGWSLYVADDNGVLAAMLAMHLPDCYLDMLFVAPEYQGDGLGRRLLAFTRQQLPDEIWLRCVRENEKAWRWYEREGFVFEKEQVEPMMGRVMKYYRWKKKGVAR